MDALGLVEHLGGTQGGVNLGRATKKTNTFLIYRKHSEELRVIRRLGIKIIFILVLGTLKQNSLF